MSITDSSTNLDLAWTEQTIVAFTTGVLSDIDACVDEVESKLKRGTLGATSTPTETQVKNWLKRYKMELAEIKRFTFNRKYATASTTAGTYRYALPADFNGGATRLRDTTNDRYIKIWDTHWGDMKYPDPSAESNNKPAVAYVKNMELWLIPPPDGTYTLELEYDRSGAESDTDNFDWIPELDRFRICDGATADAFESIHDYNSASIYRRKWEYGLGKAVRADGKRKWSSCGYQAISIFQSRAISQYQSLDD
jgi:hypothetical protein